MIGEIRGYENLSRRLYLNTPKTAKTFKYFQGFGNIGKMSDDKTTLKDIAKLLAMLKPEQIAELNIPKPNRAYVPKVYHIDYSARIKRLAINDLYFSSAICPHQVGSFEEYKEHDEGIRQQAMSCIDIEDRL